MGGLKLAKRFRLEQRAATMAGLTLELAGHAQLMSLRDWDITDVTV